MKLYVLRHGDAPFTGAHGERALSQKGVAATRQIVVNRLEALKNVQHIVCSPLLRARQTMEVVVAELGNPSLRVSFNDCLKTEGTLDALASFLSRCPEQDTLLVSHQPLVGRLVNYLADQEGLGYRMGTSCLAAFDLIAFARGGGTLEWLDTV